MKAAAEKLAPAPAGTLEVDSVPYEGKSTPRCKCLPVGAWMFPNACVVEIAAPDV